MRRLIICFIKLAFKHCESNHSIYVLHIHGHTLIVAVYVDDLFITGNNINLILELKKQLVETFEMTNIGILHLFFDLQVLQMHDVIFLSQPKYILDLLRRFKMDDCKTCATPFQSRVKLTKEFDSPKVDATFYK